MKDKISYFYIFYCIFGILCSPFHIEGISISYIEINYFLLHIIIILCLIFKKVYTWFALMLILLVTFPIGLQYGTNNPYEKIAFTMAPIIRLPLERPWYIYFWLRSIGQILQVILIIWLVLKETRIKYKISK